MSFEARSLSSQQVTKKVTGQQVSRISLSLSFLFWDCKCMSPHSFSTQVLGIKLGFSHFQGPVLTKLALQPQLRPARVKNVFGEIRSGENSNRMTACNWGNDQRREWIEKLLKIEGVGKGHWLDQMWRQKGKFKTDGYIELESSQKMIRITGDPNRGKLSLTYLRCSQGQSLGHRAEI